jgi:hypothetical protein
VWLGKKKLGQELLLSVLAVDGSGIVSWPTLPPLLDIWKGTTLVTLASGLKMPKIDSATVAHFRLPVFLDGRFSAGYYEAIMRWTNGTYLGVQIDSFQIVSGGHVDGSITSMFHHELPHARYLVAGHDSGLIKRYKNPSN